MSLSDWLMGIFSSPQPQQAAPVSDLSKLLSGISSHPATDKNMLTTFKGPETKDSGGMPLVSDGEMNNQLIANYFSLPSDQRNINSPMMQAIKQQIQANRMQLLMQQAKNPKREYSV